MRRTIAKRLGESIGPIPHFFLTVDYDVTNLLSLRQQMLEIHEGVKISVNDLIVRAVALALRAHPNVNSSWGDEAITQHGEAGAKDDLDAARLFIPMAMRRTRRAIRALERNGDDLMRAVAQRALDTGDLTVPTPTDLA
jgi:pyruvate dehydrogenase E2 component (dihydrolipoamide acetyltransferase)